MTPTETKTTPKVELLREPQLDVPAEHQSAARRAVENAIYAAYRDRPFTIPQSPEERANGFAAWLAQKWQRLEPKMRAAVGEAFEEDISIDEITLRKYVDCCVWPEVEYWLNDFAIRYYAGLWVQKHYGDAIYTTPIERFGAYWRVSIGVNGYGRNLGQIVLDNEGSVIEELTTTTQKLDEQLHGRTFSAAETVRYW